MTSAGDSQLLDSCARLNLDRRGRRGAYFWLGLAGIAVGAVVCVFAGAQWGPGALASTIAVAGSVAGFVVGIKVAHVFYGREELVLYQQSAAALAGAAAALSIAGEPLRPGLDLVAVGVAVFLVFGRLGCLHVGCCHGRPHRWGVRYGDAHGRAGFTRYYIGVRLFPIQLVAAVTHGAIAAGLLAIYIANFPAGEVVCTYLAAYAPARFALEIARGDPDRGFALGLSQAQWIAIVSGWMCVWLGARWGLAGGSWYLASALVTSGAGVAAAATARLLRRRGWGARHVHRIRELAGALEELGSPGDSVAVARTAGGLIVSVSRDDEAVRYALSSEPPLHPSAARVVTDQIAALRGHAGLDLSSGERPGVFHLRG